MDKWTEVDKVYPCSILILSSEFSRDTPMAAAVLVDLLRKFRIAEKWFIDAALVRPELRPVDEGVKMCLAKHDIFPYHENKVVRDEDFLFYNFLICLSPWDTECARQLMPRCIKKKIFILSNFFRSSHCTSQPFQRLAWRARLWGVIQKEKGYEELIQAYYKMNDVYENLFQYYRDSWKSFLIEQFEIVKHKGINALRVEMEFDFKKQSEKGNSKKKIKDSKEVVVTCMRQLDVSEYFTEEDHQKLDMICKKVF